MAGKRRFGVSMRAEVSSRLDDLCKKLKVDRSKIVEQAVLRYLEELEHYSRSHHCVSLIVAMCLGEAQRLRELVHKHSDKVVVDIHSHSGNYCRVIFVVESSSDSILEIYRHASAVEECRVSLLSLHDEKELG